MTCRARSSLLLLACVAWPVCAPAALLFEIHPGIYNAYEYSDNYRGEVSGGTSESIYTVGPNLSINGSSPTTQIVVSGRYTRTFHDTFPEDDSPEIILDSRASFSGQRNTAGLRYAFLRTLTRDTLAEAFGERRTHTGGFSDTWSASQLCNLSIGYDVSVRDWRGDPLADEDLTTHAGNVGVMWRMSPRTTADFTLRRTWNLYERSADVVEMGGTGRIDHGLTPSATLGVVALYNHENRAGGAVDVDRYDTRGTLRYALESSWTLTLEAGLGLLAPEGLENEASFVGSAGLEKVLEYDRFVFRGEKAYTSDFTSSLYGTYDTMSADLEWTRRLHASLSSTVRIHADRRKPTGATVDEEQRNTSSSVSIAYNPMEHFRIHWKPVERFTVSVNWRYLRTSYETSGVARENRYGSVVEVGF